MQTVLKPAIVISDKVESFDIKILPLEALHDISIVDILLFSSLMSLTDSGIFKKDNNYKLVFLHINLVILVQFAIFIDAELF